MAKNKTEKKAVAPVAAAKPTAVVDAPSSKKADSKKAAKASKKDKKVQKLPTPEPESESESESESDSASSEEESDSSESEEEEAKPAAKTNGASKKAAAPAPAESDDSSEESSDDEVPAVVAAPASQAKPVPATEDDEDDEDDSDDSSDSSDDEDDEEAVEPARAVQKRKAEADEAAPAKKAKTEESESETKSKNLFVGNLSWNVDEDWLSREFAEFGAISGVRIITDRESGRSKGFGYVEFENIADATKALDAKKGALLDGRNLNVDYSTPRADNNARNDRSQRTNDRASKYGDQKSTPSETLFVGNISFEATQDIFQETFAEYGTVTRVSLPTDPDTGALKGFGYVAFSSVDEAKAAHEALNGAEIAGRAVRLDFATPRPEGSGGGRGGFRGGRGGDRGGRGGGRGGGFRGGRGGDRGGRGGRGGGRGGFSTNRGGVGDFSGKKMTF